MSNSRLDFIDQFQPLPAGWYNYYAVGLDRYSMSVCPGMLLPLGSGPSGVAQPGWTFAAINVDGALLAANGATAYLGSAVNAVDSDVMSVVGDRTLA